MGACDFSQAARGKTPQEAFRAAVEQAQYDHGHAGYSGTIAEKHSFVMIDLPPGADPNDYAYKLINDGDPRVDDKWGDAGCIHVGDDEYLFFGWASC